MRQNFKISAFVCSLALPLITQAQTQSPDPDAVNPFQFLTCVSLANNELKPNTKDPNCKVIVNKPGADSSQLSIATSINFGTAAAPKTRPTQIDVTLTKLPGTQGFKLDQKITDTTTNNSDTYHYDMGPQQEIISSRVTQGGSNFALVSKSICEPLKPFVKAFAAQRVAECAMVLASAEGPIKQIMDTLAKSKSRLANVTVDASTPSLMKYTPLDVESLRGVSSILGDCGMMGMAEDQQAAKTAKPTTAPATSTQ